MKINLLVAAIALILTIFIPSTHSQISTPEATIEAASQMESAPTNCGPLPEPLAISEYYGPVLGMWPIWGTFSSGGEKPRGVLAMPLEHPRGSQLEGWWAQKVLWLVKTNYDGEVRLKGLNVADGSPMYFTFGDSLPIEEAIFNPESPGAYAQGSEQFANFPSLVWVSKAGCYLIEAEWNGGLWQQTVAVGYVDSSLF